MQIVQRVLIALLIGVAVIAASVPLGLYWVALNNINGRPARPESVASAQEDNTYLQREFGRKTPIRVHRLTPWHYALIFVPPTSRLIESDDGDRAAGLIVRQYNGSHLKNPGMIWWHLSGAALTIWLTQNWTTNEVVVDAATIERSFKRQRGI